MATVYLAEDLKHHRKVAIKVLREDLWVSLGPERFLREIDIAAGLTHPHILPLHDSGEAAGRLFYVMPFIDGPTLRQRLERGGELPIAEAVRVLRDIADAMAAAHARGVVHRDIKPENVMLSGRHALVADFGVAKAVSEATGDTGVTSAGVALGTPAYMAPEQATADPHIDYRADIYAFGVVAYELLTGRPPFSGRSPQEIVAAHVTRVAEPVTAHRPAVPTALASLVMRCLEKRPADRWQSAEELVTGLEELQTTSAVTEPADVAARGSRARSRRVALGAMAIVVLAAVAALVASLLRARATPVKERIAVLPLENRTGDPGRNQLGALAADWITRGLVDARLTEVVPSTLAMQAASEARARKEDVVHAVATATGATKLVTGAFYSMGDSLRFEAELLNTATSTSVTGIRPSLAPALRPMVAIDSLRHRVMGAVAQLVGNPDPFPSAPPPSLEAYQLVLRAGEGLSSGRYAEMERYYRQSFALDSTYVAAGTGLVNALWLMGRYAEADTILRRVESLPKPAPGDAFFVRVFRAYLDGNRQAAYELFKADSALLGDGAYRVQFAIEAIETARPREAVRILDQVNWRSPEVTRDAGLWQVRPVALHLLGDDDHALEAVRQSRGMFPSDPALTSVEAAILAALGRKPDLERLKQEANGAPYYGLVLNEIAAEQFLRGDSVSGRATAREAIDWFRMQPGADSAANREPSFFAQVLGGRRADLEIYVKEECDSLAVGCWGRRGIAAALRGDMEGARAAAATIESLALTPRLTQARASLALTQIYASLGEEDRAVMYARDAFGKGESWGYNVRRSVAPFPRVQAHAGFRELMRPKG
jgi:TolB-like protein